MASGIFEIRIHGRGGQGAKTAAQLIAEASMDEGKYIQAFPEYGPERTGAPMVAFARVSDREIRTYSPVTKPDVVMVIDPTMIGTVDVTSGLPDEGILLVNSNKTPEDVRKITGFRGRIGTIDATKISIDLLGKSMPNTPLLGALVKASGIVRLESLEKRIESLFGKKMTKEVVEANKSCLKRAYEEVRII